MIGKMTKKWFGSIMIAASLVVLLAGCGQKGDLYIPGSETAEEENEEDNSES